MEYSYGIIPIYKDIWWKYFFLLINQKTQNHSFRWFPKWHKEPWETDIQAAKRELKEETGITDIQINKNKKWILKYTYNLSWIEKNKKVFFRVGFVLDKNVTIQVAEVNDYLRCSKKETLSKLTHKNTKIIFQKICDYLKIE